MIAVDLAPPPDAAPAPPAPAPATTLQDWAMAVALGCLLLSVYLLTFNGRFRSIDELSFFGSTENWVLNRSLEPRLIWFHPYHNPIGPFEPAYSLLASPLYAAAWAQPGVSQAYAVMLLNPLLTAATAAALYLLGRQLGYKRFGALAGAVAFGLGTLAWPYTKSFLREPAVALLWVLSFWGLAACVRRPSWKLALLAAAPVVLAVGFKVTSGVAAPVVVGVLAWSLYRAGKLHLLVLLALCALSVYGVAQLTLVLLARRDIPLDFLLERLLPNVFTQNGLLVWYGLLFSPGKSVFIYSPLLVLGVLGWPLFFLRRRLMAVTLALVTAGFLLSVWATGWDAGVSWGPRYALPLLALWVLPALELLPNVLALAWAALCVGFQALVATADWSQAYHVLFERYPGVDPDLAVGLDWLRWRESPVVELLRLWGRRTLDLLWLHSGLAQEIKLDLPLGIGLASAAAVSGLALLAVWRWRRAAPGAALALVGVVAAAGLLVVRGTQDMPDYPSLTASTAQRLAEYLSTHRQPPDAIINVSSDIGTYAWLGLVKGPAQRTWISPLHAESFEALWAATPGEELAVVMDRPHIARHREPDMLLTWLNTHAYRLGNEWIEGYEIVRYAALEPVQEHRAANLVWPTGVALTDYAVPRAVTPGTVLPVELTFTVLRRDWSQYDRLFTNLIGPDGRVLVGQENWLAYGNAGGAYLAAGATALDQRGLYIPPEAPPGVYVLVVGFINAGGFVQPDEPAGSGNYVRLVEVTVATDS